MNDDEVEDGEKLCAAFAVSDLPTQKIEILKTSFQPYQK